MNNLYWYAYDQDIEFFNSISQKQSIARFIKMQRRKCLIPTSFSKYFARYDRVHLGTGDSETPSFSANLFMLKYCHESRI